MHIDMMMQSCVRVLFTSYVLFVGAYVFLALRSILMTSVFVMISTSVWM